MLHEYYRTYELAWATDERTERAFRKLWIGLLVGSLILGVLVWLVDLPEQMTQVQPSVPARLAKIVIERELPPPPPPPPPELPKPEETLRPRQTARPDLAPTQTVRERAARAGLLAFQDDLADIRQQFELTREQLENTANTTGAVEGPARAERSLITSRVGASSGGITSAPQSRGFGSGSGNLGGHSTTEVVVPFGGSGRGDATTAEERGRGGSGRASRSAEEIEMVFDRNKGAIYALYSRALRERPELQGKMVLEFTIAPSGEITMCRVVSSELNDPDLERKIIARVRLFRFPAKDVDAVTTTKPIDFFPA